jgi:predicted alpha/beta-fold hydrolase
LLPEFYPLEGLEEIRTLKEFDDRYTAPLHGFLSAEDYWAKGSCLPVLGRIKRPALLLNAKNDPFLGGECFPVEAARRSAYLYLEMPEEGGHVGFMSPVGRYWSEERALAFTREFFG